MPTLNIEGVASVNVGDEFLKLSPDQQNQTVDEITQHLKQSPVTAMGLAKAAGSGLERAGIGFAGLGGDVQSLLRSLAEKTGVQLPENIPMPNLLVPGGGAMQTPTTERLTQAVERKTGPIYQPKNVPEQYAETIGEFAPSAIGGEGGAIRRGLQTVVPALASEAAGQATAGTPFEPAARAAGALVAGPGAVEATAPRGLVETSAIRKAKDAAYGAAHSAGVMIKSDAFDRMVAGIVHATKKAGIDKDLTPQSYAMVKRLISKTTQGPKSLQDFDIERQLAGGAYSSAARTGPNDRRVAEIITNRMDEVMDKPKKADFHGIMGDPKVAGPLLRNARGLYRQLRKAEDLDYRMEAVGLKAGQYSVSGEENAIRTVFRNLATEIAKAKRDRRPVKWNLQEQKIIRQLGNMRSGVNMLRWIGKLAPMSQLMLGADVGGGIASAYTGDPRYAEAAVGTSIVGGLGKLGATALTKRKLNQLQELVRGGRMREAPLSLNPLTLSTGTLPLREDE